MPLRTRTAQRAQLLSSVTPEDSRLSREQRSSVRQETTVPPLMRDTRVTLATTVLRTWRIRLFATMDITSPTLDNLRALSVLKASIALTKSEVVAIPLSRLSPALWASTAHVGRSLRLTVATITTCPSKVVVHSVSASRASPVTLVTIRPQLKLHLSSVPKGITAHQVESNLTVQQASTVQLGRRLPPRAQLALILTINFKSRTLSAPTAQSTNTAHTAV